MRVGNFNTEHATNLVNQLKNNTDADVIKVIAAQHSRQISDLVSSISSVQGSIGSKMSPILKIPAPYSPSIVAWAVKVAAGVAIPQIKAQMGFASHLASAASSIGEIGSALSILKEVVQQATDISGASKSELFDIINGAMSPANELDDSITSAIGDIMENVSQYGDLINSVTSGNTTFDTSSVSSFLASANSTIESLENDVNALLTAEKPENTSVPTISGNNSVDSVLTLTSNGQWTGTDPIEYTFQWQRDGADIPSATSTTYTLTVNDRGSVVRCAVAAKNIADAVIAYSANTATVIMLPYNRVAPSITGTETEGSVLTLDVGQWVTNEPTDPPEIKWFRNTTEIIGESNTSYTLVTADVGNTIKAMITVTNSDGSTSANTAPTGIIA